MTLRSQTVAPSWAFRFLNQFNSTPYLLVLLTLLAVTTITPTSSVSGDDGVASFMQAAEDTADIPEGASKPSRAVRVVIPMKDDGNQRITGKVAWFTKEKLGYVDEKDTPQSVAWDALDASQLPRYLRNLPDRRDAEGLLIASELLIQYEGKERDITKLLAYAKRADPATQPRIEALYERLANRGKSTPGSNAGGGDTGTTGGSQPNAPTDSTNPRAWPPLTEKQHADAIAELKKRTDAVLTQMGHEMGSTETERFLVYSDLPADESRYWVSVLDKMYNRLCEVFDIDKKTNIFRGKCLLLFFTKESDYLKYNQTAYGGGVAGSAGVCWSFGSGDVHIAMYRKRNKLDLAAVLVHEAVHGFLHRYISSYRIQNWLNEGLAEYISASLVESGEYPGRAMQARSFVRGQGRLGNFLSAPNIIGEHYGLAFDVTDLMIDENRKGYVKMIRGIKAGLSVEQAFDQEYGASLNRTLQYYAKKRLKMDNLRMD